MARRGGGGRERSAESEEKRGEPGTEDQFAVGATPNEVTSPPDADSDATGEDRVDGAREDGGGAGVDATDGARDGAPAEDRTLEDQREKYLRLAAEFDNFRKRSTRERQESGARAQAELVAQLLDALDDMARVTDLDPDAVDAATVVEGVELVEKKMLKALGKAGLVVLDPVDEAFDPAVHEAIATEPALSAEDENLIGKVYQVGYLFNGQLLRPARVVVKQWNG